MIIKDFLCNENVRKNNMKQLILPLLLISSLGFAQNNAQIIRCDIDRHNHTASNLRVAAISIKTIRNTPAVVSQNTANFLLEVIIGGKPSSIEFEFDGNPTRVKLVDNGTNGDKVANDGTYSITINKPSAGWNQNKVLGYIYSFENGVQQSKYNFFTEVRSADMPTPVIRKITDKIQITDYIFNIVDEVGSKDFANEIGISKEFYKYHRDDYDFLNFILVPGYTDNRFHSNLRNAVQGIGQINLDAGQQYGSAARLKGFNYAPQLSIFDGINDGFSHETGHQWINYAKTSFLKDGLPHFPASNIANSVMGISIGGAGGAGGGFRFEFIEEGNNYRLVPKTEANNYIFNDWELYLMGLLPASEVKTQAIVFKDQSKYPTVFLYPKTDFNYYTINDFITQVGKRVPDFVDSQKQFTMATIVVSERLLNEDEMAYLNHNLKRTESNVAVEIRNGLITSLAKPFRFATGDRATLRTLLNTNANCATVPAKPSILSNNLKFCDGSQAELSVNLNSGEQAIWYFRGVPLDDRTAKISAKETTGGYTVNIRRADGCNSLESNEVKLIKIASPNAPQIQSSNGTDLAFGKTTVLSTPSVAGLNYQWLKNNSPIANATSNSFTVSESGDYSLRVSNADACTNVSATTKITVNPQVLSNEEDQISDKFRISPNPANENLKVDFYTPKTSTANLNMVNLEGKIVYKSSNIPLTSGWNTIELNIQNLAAGQYFMALENAGQVYKHKIIILK